MLSPDPLIKVLQPAVVTVRVPMQPPGRAIRHDPIDRDRPERPARPACSAPTASARRSAPTRSISATVTALAAALGPPLAPRPPDARSSSSAATPRESTPDDLPLAGRGAHRRRGRGTSSRAWCRRPAIAWLARGSRRARRDRGLGEPQPPPRQRHQADRRRRLQVESRSRGRARDGAARRAVRCRLGRALSTSTTGRERSTSIGSAGTVPGRRPGRPARRRSTPPTAPPPVSPRRSSARLGAEAHSIHDQPDGRNINQGCGSTHPEAVAAADRRSAAPTSGAAFDGDGDRAILADETGAVRDGDAMLYLWARALRRAGELEPPAIVATTMSNLGLERALAARRHRGRALRRRRPRGGRRPCARAASCSAASSPATSCTSGSPPPATACSPRSRSRACVAAAGEPAVARCSPASGATRSCCATCACRASAPLERAAAGRRRRAAPSSSGSATRAAWCCATAAPSRSPGS